jgi:sec-independent protein translocase protein TatC
VTSLLPALLRRAPRPSPQAMTLGQHLGELRGRIMKILVALTVAGVVGFVAYPQILHLLQAPYCQVARPCRLYLTGPLDGLSLRVKVAGYAAVALASPVILWQLWRFITPGLSANEKRYAVPFVVSSIVLFGTGAALAFAVFPHALQFLGSIGGPSLHQIYTPNNYLGLILALMTVFGVTFEFPVVLVALELAGIVSPAALARRRRWALVGVVTLAAVITPSGDPLSMMALALPLYVFYEISIILGRVLHRPSTGGNE